MNIAYKLPFLERQKLEWQRESIDKSYEKEIGHAIRANKSSNEIDSLRQCHRHELNLMDEEIDYLITRKILKEARRLKIPLPEFDVDENGDGESWERGSQTGMYYLTSSGYSHLREKIRSEKRSQVEFHNIRISWIVSLTGLIGTIIGLIAVWSNKS
ncbi:MAG: hypothetical protein Q7L07_16575 [Pseudohongiella sp.]|nr:hypothetical protein [Pseudohongiella sp.]